jgi:hypothetical protein
MDLFDLKSIRVICILWKVDKRVVFDIVFSIYSVIVNLEFKNVR